MNLNNYFLTQNNLFKTPSIVKTTAVLQYCLVKSLANKHNAKCKKKKLPVILIKLWKMTFLLAFGSITCMK